MDSTYRVQPLGHSLHFCSYCTIACQFLVPFQSVVEAMARDYVTSWEKAGQAFFNRKLLEMDVEKYGELLLSCSFVASPCVCGFAQNGARLRLHIDSCTNILSTSSSSCCAVRILPLVAIVFCI